MNLSTLIKSETAVFFNQKVSFEKLESPAVEIPRTIAVRWWWKQHSWAAYQLPNGVKVMSDRQMALMVGQSKTNVKNFVESNNLETITVQIPKRMF